MDICARVDLAARTGRGSLCECVTLGRLLPTRMCVCVCCVCEGLCDARVRGDARSDAMAAVHCQPHSVQC